jgi:hypothetical protein
MKVKIFTGLGLDLEKRINYWLSENDGKIIICYIKQASGLHNFMVSIFYEEDV